MRLLFAASLYAVCVLLGISSAQAQSQDYPNRSVRMVVPFPAGGPTDGMARIISDRLSAVLGQTVVVENRGGGAGGSIGAKFVAASEPDGYTILITPGGALTTGPAVHKEKIGYDPTQVFVPVAQLIEAPIITSVHPDLPVKSLAELVAYAKANPSKVNWGSQGFGTAPHLLAELFKLETGVDLVHVPFRGTAPLLTAIVAGQVQVAADPSTTSLPHIQNGKLRPIAVNSKQRFAKLPDVPTVFEAGFPYLENTFWLGVVAPAKTPPEIIKKLNNAFRETLKTPQARERLANLGADVKIGTPAEFGEFLAEERAKWNRVVKEANITVK